MELGCELTIGKSLLSETDDNAFDSWILWPLQQRQHLVRWYADDNQLAQSTHN